MPGALEEDSRGENWLSRGVFACRPPAGAHEEIQYRIKKITMGREGGGKLQGKALGHRRDNPLALLSTRGFQGGGGRDDGPFP
eukprot:7397291-Alexandrium_andersonii.AAC.1